MVPHGRRRTGGRISRGRQLEERERLPGVLGQRDWLGCDHAADGGTDYPGKRAGKRRVRKNSAEDAHAHGSRRGDQSPCRLILRPTDFT